jgi:hypothetical protein
MCIMRSRYLDISYETLPFIGPTFSSSAYWCSGGWSPKCPICTTTTNRPIVPAPGHYDDGEISE